MYTCMKALLQELCRPDIAAILGIGHRFHSVK